MSTRAIVLVTRPDAALRRVAGMGLLQRVVRTASATGAEVLVTGSDESARSALADTLSAHDGPVTLWLAHHVYDRSAVAPAVSARAAAAAITADDPEAAVLHAVSARSIDASTEAGAATATEALWQSCRKPIDGIVSRNVNRHISLAISRRLVDTKITPNQVSALCIALGILSGVLAAHGGYAYLLAGATLFKLNSILDGVDGELARVRWQYSKLGELLDSAGDNVANFSFFGGVTVAAQRAGFHDLATAGMVGLSLWALYLLFLYSRLSGTGRGDVMQVRTNLDELRSPLVQAALAFGRTTLRRDSFVMVSFLAAVLGYAPYLLLMILVGGSTVFAYAVLHFAARWLRPRSMGALEIDSP